MGIPQQVIEAGKRADEILKKIGEGENPDPQGQNLESQNQPEPRGNGDDYKEKYEASIQEIENLKHQIETVQGKLDGEVPHLSDVNKKLAEELADLKLQQSDLIRKFNEKPAGPDPSEEELKNLLAGGFDEGLLKVIDIKIAKAVKESEERMRGYFGKEISPRVEKVERHIQTREAASFESQMDGLVNAYWTERGLNINWKRLNQPNTEFSRWAETDFVHGVSRLELMRMAADRGDVKSVAGHFNDFIAIKNPEAAKTAPKKDGGKVEDDDFIDPGKSGGGNKPPKQPKEEKERIYKRSEIKTFYRDRALGRFKHKQKWADEEKARMDKALQEGKIADG